MKRLLAAILGILLLSVPVSADWQQIRTNLDAIDLLVSETRGLIPQDSPVTIVTTTSTTSTTTTIKPAGNPYADTPAMIPLKSDDRLSASPKILDNALGSRYWKTLWDIADRAKVKLIILRGAHPDGRIDIQYPSISGRLDKAAMGRVIDAFLAICAPPLPPSEAWKDSWNESEIRMGSDVWPLTNNRHLQIDDALHHRFDDALYPHFHLRLP